MQVYSSSGIELIVRHLVMGEYVFLVEQTLREKGLLSVTYRKEHSHCTKGMYNKSNQTVMKNYMILHKN